MPRQLARGHHQRIAQRPIEGLAAHVLEHHLAPAAAVAGEALQHPVLGGGGPNRLEAMEAIAHGALQAAHQFALQTPQPPALRSLQEGGGGGGQHGQQ